MRHVIGSLGRARLPSYTPATSTGKHQPCTPNSGAIVWLRPAPFWVRLEACHGMPPVTLGYNKSRYRILLRCCIVNDADMTRDKG